MSIQWQARTFHAFGHGDGNRLVYDVPCSAEPMFGELDNQVYPASIVYVRLIQPGTLRVEIKY